MSRLRPIQLAPDSPLIGEPCALCQSPFVAGDKLALCPVDGARHHTACWEANHNHCVALGCVGEGQLSGRVQTAVDTAVTEAPLIIGDADPLLDPANLPRPPHGRRAKKGRWRKVTIGCAFALGITVVLLCIAFVVALSLIFSNLPPVS